MPATFKYDGFISYTSADLCFAEALQYNLENNFFRLGKEARKDKEKLHLLRDRSDVEGAENIDALFELKLSECKHLLVVCSENVVLNPYWVNKEIGIFKRIRKPQEQKIIVIGLQIADPVTPESFPTELVDGGELPLAMSTAEFKDLRPKGLFHRRVIDSFQLKLFALLLDIPYYEFIDRHKKYLKRQKGIRMLTLVSVVLLLVVAGFVAWQSRNIVTNDRRKATLDSMNVLIDEVRSYRSEGIMDVRNSCAVGLAFYNRFPYDADFLEARVRLDSLCK